LKKKYFKYYLAAAVSAFVFLVYLAALGNEFVNWDDRQYLLGNPHILSFDLTFLRWAFFDFYAFNWHPLTWVSHALDYAVWGWDPFGHHLTNNILHAVNSFLVVVLVARLVESADDDPRFTLIVAGTTGVLFGLHPIHVESVAWVAERKDLLCALFYLSSSAAYLKYTSASLSPGVRGEKTRWYLLALCFFILALMSKPMAVSLPVVLLLLDWYPLKRTSPRSSLRIAFIEKLPFIAFGLLSSLLTILAQQSGGAVQSADEYLLSMRVFTAAKALVAYLGKLIVPVDLVPFYPYPEDISIFTTEYLFVIALPLLITAACLVTAKKQKLLTSVWGYYVATLIPVLGIVQVGGQSMADRYMYLPSLGPFLIAGLGVAWVSRKAHAMEKLGLLVKVVAASVMILAVVSLTYLTLKQIHIWKNSIALWTYVIEKEPGKVRRAYMNRSAAFCEIGQYDKAIADYDMAVAIAPLDPDVYYGRGLVYFEIRQFDKAIVDHSIAITLSQDGGEGFFGLKFIFFDRGLAYLQIGERGLALEDFRKACDLGNAVGCHYVHSDEAAGARP
jgi:hypothetical protein